VRGSRGLRDDHAVLDGAVVVDVGDVVEEPELEGSVLVGDVGATGAIGELPGASTSEMALSATWVFPTRTIRLNTNANAGLIRERGNCETSQETEAAASQIRH